LIWLVAHSIDAAMRDGVTVLLSLTTTCSAAPNATTM